MGNDRSWMAPLTGLAFFVLALISFAIGGEPPDVTEEPVEEVVDWYVDNDSSVIFGAALEGLGATLFIFFGGVLRRTLRDAEGEGGILSAVAFAGTIVFGVGLAIDATISFTLAETAEDIEPSAVQALAALWENDFMPFAVGLQVFMFSLGLSVLRHGALPKWIGWLALLFAITAVTPAGFIAFLGGGLMVAVVSVMLAMRARSGPSAPPPVAPPPSAPAV